jgi:peptide/nickel transport system ATP-binding protein
MRLLPERTGKVKSGSILFGGEDILRLKEGDMRAVRGERISMIFQDPMTSLNPILSVGDQISEALLLHNDAKRTKTEIEARVDEVLELVGIPKFRKVEYPHQFSGGMKQRVVIAIALACEPELLIADEPTTALDVTIQAQVLSMIAELRNKLKTSMILITHDFGIVAQTCEKVAVMYAGEVIEYGTAEDVFEADKHHPYTTGLFGSIPDLENECEMLTPIEGLMPDPTNLPKGCKFSPRCPRCMDICRVEQPGEYVRGTHRIACHLFR